MIDTSCSIPAFNGQEQDAVAYDAAEDWSRTSLRLIEEAINILDEVSAPADIAAHLDLARCRLLAAVGEENAADEIPPQWSEFPLG